MVIRDVYKRQVTRRLAMVIRLLGEETEILKIENEIQDELKTQIDKNQREYYLREQIKVIQSELGEQDVTAEADNYRKRVLELHLPQECEDKLIHEVDRFAKLSGSSAEQGVVRTYLDTVLELPWNKKSEERLDLGEAQAILDRDHYGLKKVKERIICLLYTSSIRPGCSRVSTWSRYTARREQPMRRVSVIWRMRLEGENEAV